MNKKPIKPILYLNEDQKEKIKAFSDKEKIDSFHVAGRKLLRIALEKETTQ